MVKNKVVLITGASSGIGMACAEKFAEAGARLFRQEFKDRASDVK